MESSTENKKIKVAIAEPRQLFRNLLISIIGKRKDMQIVGIAAADKELISLLKGKHPDVALINPDMLISRRLEGVKKITQKYPHVKCILLHEAHLGFLKSQFNMAGAFNFLSMNSDVDIIEIIRAAKNNRALQVRPILSNEVETLSGREQEILKLICKRKDISHIAKTLKMDIGSAELHRMSLYNKTNTDTFQDLTKIAAWLGLE